MLGLASEAWSVGSTRAKKFGRKYQFMQVNTERRSVGLREKIPDIQKTLETVKF